MQLDITKAPEDIKNAIKGFFHDYARLFRASKSTAVLLGISHVFLGLLPLLELITLFGLTDALIGARTLGISTKDVTTFMWYQVGLLIATIPALFFASQLSGTTKRLGWITVEVCLIVSLFFAALPIAPILLFVILVAAFVVHYFPNKWILLSYSLVVLLLMVQNFSNVLNVTVHRGATVGQAVLLGGSLLVFSSWLALRPYLRKL